MFKLLNKISEWIPGRKEYYNAKIRRIKRRMDELVDKKADPKLRIKYDSLAYKLHVYEAEVGGINS